MRAALGLIGLLAVLAVGYYIFTAQVAPVVNGGSPVQQMDLVAVKSDLLSLAQCERFYLATNGSYGTIEQLRQAGSLNPFPGDNHRGYVYEVEIKGGAHFRITAKPVDPAKGELPTLSIDETMKIVW
jgi:hypothetical protein